MTGRTSPSLGARALSSPTYEVDCGRANLAHGASAVPTDARFPPGLSQADPDDTTTVARVGRASCTALFQPRSSRGVGAAGSIHGRPGATGAGAQFARLPLGDWHLIPA